MATQKGDSIPLSQAKHKTTWLHDRWKRFLRNILFSSSRRS